MAAYVTMLDEIRPKVSGCSDPLIVGELRKCVIDICERGRIIRRKTLAQVVTQDDPMVEVVSEAGFRLIHLMSMTLDKQEVNKTSMDQLALFDKEGDRTMFAGYNWHGTEEGNYRMESWQVYREQRPRLYYIERSDDGDFIRLVGIPTRGYTDLQYIRVLAPTRDSTGVDSWFIERYYEQIEHGTLARLMAMPNKEWSDPAGSVYYRGLFETWLTKIARDGATDFTRDDESTGRVTSHY